MSHGRLCAPGLGPYGFLVKRTIANLKLDYPDASPTEAAEHLRELASDLSEDIKDGAIRGFE